ncbi:MAG: biotin-dependent carboxyltransferase family protein [Undibacterium sp.]|nr:biotin-dependent carboxyltransferase family protein [Undibacterium sp.]
MSKRAEIEIIKAGLQTTVQDLGRVGSRHLGIAQSGALDRPSFQLANYLVGNAAHAAGVEIVVGPVQIRFHSKCWFALTGADFDARLNGERVAPAWRVLASAGDLLSLSGTRYESRCYLALSGGIDVPEVLGACATDLPARFGGYQGRALRAGDFLSLGNGRQFDKSMGVLQRTWTPEIRAIAGPEYTQFSEASRSSFWRQAWKVSHQSNRMGFRLQGHALQRVITSELLSHAVLPGVVQVPPNGQPIVLLADAQTTGGYPRIATVIEADLWKVAQTPIGTSFCFEQCSLATALDAQEKWRKEFARFDWLQHAK